METKVCIKCGIEKDISEFHLRNSSKKEYRRDCKVCCSLYNKKYREENEEKVKKRKILHYEKNRDRIIEKSKNYRENNYEKVKEKDRLRSKLRYQTRKDDIKIYSEKHKEKIRENKRRYEEKNKEFLKEKRKKVISERIKIDPVFHIKQLMRKRVYDFITRNGIVKKNRTFDVVGCTPEFLKEHLEKQFKEGMSWENRGKWHIDHIIPLSSAKTEDELYELCHYTNLQPLWAEDNLKKGNKIL